MRRFDFGFLKDPAYLLYQAGNLVQGLGFFLPSIYLPTYAGLFVTNQGSAGGLTAALPLVFVNISSVAGCLLMGVLIDRLSVASCIFISSVGSTLAVLALWGTTASLAQLYAFCLLYGLFAGSFSTTWSGIVRTMTQRSASASPDMVYAFMFFTRGVGSVISGPLSSTLLKGGQDWSGSLGYSSGYGGIIVFVGVTALVGGVSFPAMLAGWL